jgi:ABC-type uncharacterized transport system permease subunit
MMLPALALVVWAFREYIDVPWMGVWRLALFLGSIVLAYALLTQIKFLLGISAFWIAEPRRFSRNLEYSDGSFRWPIATAQPVAGLAADSGASVAVRIVIRVSYGTVAWPTEYSGHRIRLCPQAIWLLGLTALVRWSWKRGLLATRLTEAEITTAM